MTNKIYDRERRARYHEASKERDNTRSSEYYAEHKEKLNSISRARYTETKEKKAEYRSVHQEERRAYAKVYSVERREKLSAQRKAWRETHQAEIIAYRKAAQSKLVPIAYRWYEPATGLTEYVGRGTIRRAMSHRSQSNWWTPELKLQTQVALSEAHAMELEGRWIRKYQPAHNKEGYRR